MFQTGTLYIVCIALYILSCYSFLRDHGRRRPRDPRPDPGRDHPPAPSSGVYGDRHQTDCRRGRCPARVRVPLLPGRQGADRRRGAGPLGRADPPDHRDRGRRPRPARPRSTTTSWSTPSACATPTTSGAARSPPWRSRPPATTSASARCAKTCSTRWQTTLAEVFTGAGIAAVDAEPLATFVLSSYEGALTMSRALRDIQPMLTSGAAVARRCSTRTWATRPAPPDRTSPRDSRPCSKLGSGRHSAQSALIVGALLVARFPKLTEPRWLGLVMAFGAGALISAVTTDLVAEAYAEGGARRRVLLVGAGRYYALTSWLNRRAEREDPEEPVEEAKTPAVVGDARGRRRHRGAHLTVGMVLDGIPESIAIGLTLLGGASVSFGSSVRCSCRTSEAIGVAAALLAGGIPLRKVLVRRDRAGRLRRRARGLRDPGADQRRRHRDHPVDRGRRDGRGGRERDGADRGAGDAAAPGSRPPPGSRSPRSSHVRA